MTSDPAASETPAVATEAGLDPKWAKVSDDGKTVTVKLRFPFDWAKETIGTIQIRTVITAADLEEMDHGKGEVGKSLHLLSQVSGHSLTALRRLRAVDWNECQKVTAYLMGKED